MPLTSSIIKRLIRFIRNKYNVMPAFCKIGSEKPFLQIPTAKLWGQVAVATCSADIMICKTGFFELFLQIARGMTLKGYLKF